MFKKIDDKIIDAIQSAYLWLYDWTGIYVASVAAIVLLLGKAADGFRLDAINIFLTVFNLAVLMPNYLEQDRNEVTVYNFKALFLRQTMMRAVCHSMMYSLVLYEIIMGNVWGIFSSLTYVLYIYLIVICIREREPKEWFKKHEQDLAWNHTS